MTSQPGETFFHVAPIGTGAYKSFGRHEKKPWHYAVTVAIPHLDTLESLQAVVALLRRQTVAPYILIIDTGSPPPVLRDLEEMRDVDLEIHYVQGHAYAHTSEPVAVALDLAHALCRTQHLFHTHADCFLRRRDFLESLIRVTNANTPVVGYRMSPRDWATIDWQWMIGHTASMFYMPSIWRSGASWNFQRLHFDYGFEFSTGGWPDTETGFNFGLRDAGIVPVFIGHEQNGVREIDGNRDHVRSFCGARVYADANYNVPAAEWMAAALKEAWERVKVWDCEISGLAVTSQQPTSTK